MLGGLNSPPSTRTPQTFLIKGGARSAPPFHPTFHSVCGSQAFGNRPKKTGTNHRNHPGNQKGGATRAHPSNPGKTSAPEKRKNPFVSGRGDQHRNFRSCGRWPEAKPPRAVLPLWSVNALFWGLSSVANWPPCSNHHLIDPTDWPKFSRSKRVQIGQVGRFEKRHGVVFWIRHSRVKLGSDARRKGLCGAELRRECRGLRPSRSVKTGRIC